MKRSGHATRACTLVQATSTPDPAPDTGKEEKGTPRPPEAAVEGQVRLDDKAPYYLLIQFFDAVFDR